MASDNKKNPVVNYIAILFLAAFLLLMLTYLMEQREAAEMLQGIRSSVSAMETVDGLYEDNMELLTKQSELQKEIAKLEEALAKSQENIQSLEEELSSTGEEMEALTETADLLASLWSENQWQNPEYFHCLLQVEALGQLPPYLADFMAELTEDERTSLSEKAEAWHIKETAQP